MAEQPSRIEHPNVQRVIAAARDAGLPIDVHHHAEGARTAEEAARAVGCDVGQIVKSLVFMADGVAVMALMSGPDRLDPQRLAAVLGAAEVRRATADEARAATGYPIGGVPPLGHATRVQVVIDENLLRHDRVWAAAGVPDAVFAADPRRLAAAAAARTVSVAAR